MKDKVSHEYLINNYRYFNGHLYNKKTKRKLGSVDEYGYIRISILGKKYKAHRLIWFYFKAEWPKFQIDHIDRNTQNNKIENLRDVEQILNKKNCNTPKNNITGIKGISLNKNGMFQSTICAFIDGKNKNFCVYYGNDIHEAVLHRVNAEYYFGYDKAFKESPAYLYAKENIIPNIR